MSEPAGFPGRVIGIAAAIAAAVVLAATGVYLFAGGHHRSVAAAAAAPQTPSRTPIATTPITTPTAPDPTTTSPDPTTVTTVEQPPPPSPAPVGCAAQTAAQKALAQQLADGGVSCGSNVSPEFAVEILRAYKNHVDSSTGQSVTMTVASPVTAKDYTIHCAASGGIVRCHNDDSVIADDVSAGRLGANNSISFEPSAVNSPSSPLSALF